MGEWIWGLSALGEFIETILFSAYVRREGAPLSGIVIAPPDTGKSEMLLRYRHNRGLYYITDATSYGIITNLINDIVAGRINHIIIPDFLKVLSRGKVTAREFVSLLNSLIEEGVTSIHTKFMNIPLLGRARCGFLSSMTVEEYNWKKKAWKSVGFTSRFIPFFFDYTKDDLERARADVLFERNVFEERTLDFPEKEVDVKMDEKYRVRLKDIAEFIGNVNRDFTYFRAIKRVVLFVKSHALLKGRVEVTDEDITFLKAITPFWYTGTGGSDCDYFIIRCLPCTREELIETLRIYSVTTIKSRLERLMKLGVVIERDNMLETKI